MMLNLHSTYEYIMCVCVMTICYIYLTAEMASKNKKSASLILQPLQHPCTSLLVQNHPKVVCPLFDASGGKKRVK